MRPVHWLRLLAYILIAAALLIAVVPLLVLLSLVQGGSGFGLCPGGIASCRNPYTAAPELTAGLTVALLVIVAAIRILMRTARRLQADEYRVESEPEGGPAPGAPSHSNDRATR
ncbi:MAG: hypothetical protein ACLFWM_12820 [Actinomycetota bacterium]